MINFANKQCLEGRLNPLSWADRLIYFNNPWLGYIVSNEVKLNPRGGVAGR